MQLAVGLWALRAGRVFHHYRSALAEGTPVICEERGLRLSSIVLAKNPKPVSKKSCSSCCRRGCLLEILSRVAAPIMICPPSSPRLGGRGFESYSTQEGWFRLLPWMIAVESQACEQRSSNQCVIPQTRHFALYFIISGSFAIRLARLVLSQTASSICWRSPSAEVGGT